MKGASWRQMRLTCMHSLRAAKKFEMVAAENAYHFRQASRAFPNLLEARRAQFHPAGQSREMTSLIFQLASRSKESTRTRWLHRSPEFCTIQPTSTSTAIRQSQTTETAGSPCKILLTGLLTLISTPRMDGCPNGLSAPPLPFALGARYTSTLRCIVSRWLGPQTLTAVSAWRPGAKAQRESNSLLESLGILVQCQINTIATFSGKVTLIENP